MMTPTEKMEPIIAETKKLEESVQTHERLLNANNPAWYYTREAVLMRAAIKRQIFQIVHDLWAVENLIG